MEEIAMVLPSLTLNRAIQEQLNHPGAIQEAGARGPSMSNSRRHANGKGMSMAYSGAASSHRQFGQWYGIAHKNSVNAHVRSINYKEILLFLGQHA
jgi:hypothetical protein